MPTTTELTEKYITEHLSIKNCLKKGLVNYSALARLIAKDLGIIKTSSKEAILIASRRYKEKIKGKKGEEAVLELFKNSNMDIKNNVVTYTLEKNVYPDSLIEIEKQIKKEKELFYSIEGTKTITIIVQKQNSGLMDRKFKSSILHKKGDLSLITITSKNIANTPGAVHYISGLFFEKGINIEEFMSCHDDTLVVIDSKDIGDVMKVLQF